MRNKVISKFLTALISTIIVSSSNGLIFAIVENPKTKQETVVENNNKNKGEEIKPITEKELEKKEKKRYDIWKQNVKVDEKKEKEFKEKNIKEYGNFREEDYKVPHYKVKFYYKNKHPLIEYEHEETKTKIAIVPIGNLNNVNIKELFVKDSYFFRAFVPDDSGLVHYAEHCISSDTDDLAFKQKDVKARVNAHCDDKGLEIILNENNASYDLINLLIESLKHPKCLDDEEKFKKEQGRIVFEMLEKELLAELNPSLKKDREIYYITGGTSKKVAKVSIKRIRDFVKKFIHPSNLLITKQVLELNPKKIAEYLNLLHKKYLKYFKYKKIEIPKFRKKKDYDYKKYKFVDSIDGGTTYDSLSNKKENKYWARIHLLDIDNDKDREIKEKHPILSMYFLEKDGISKLKLELEKFVKNLGYDAVRVFSLSDMTLYGNKKKLFEKEALQKAYKKIYEFIAEKIKTFTDKDIERNVIEILDYNMIKNENTEDIQLLFANPMFYEKSRNLIFMFKENFINNKEIFSKDVFNINDKNEIIDSKESLIKKYKEDIKNLDNFKNRKPYKIDVYEQGESIKKTEKYRRILKNFEKPFLLPLEIKKNKENITLVSLARNFLVNGFLAEKTIDIVPTHNVPFKTGSLRPYVASNVTISKEYQQKELDYYEKGNFEKDLKNLKISEEDFEHLKENLRKNGNIMNENFKTIRKNLKTIVNSIDYYLEHGLDENAEVYDEKKGNFKIDEKTTRGYLYHVIACCLPVFFKDFEEEKDYRTRLADFVTKYGQKDYEKYRRILIDKDFVKELKEKILKPAIKAFNYNEEITKKILKEMDGVKFKDFLETVKSCGLVDKEKYEKDQKAMDSVREKVLQLDI